MINNNRSCYETSQINCTNLHTKPDSNELHNESPIIKKARVTQEKVNNKFSKQLMEDNESNFYFFIFRVLIKKIRESNVSGTVNIRIYSSKLLKIIRHYIVRFHDLNLKHTKGYVNPSTSDDINTVLGNNSIQTDIIDLKNVEELNHDSSKIKNHLISIDRINQIHRNIISTESKTQKNTSGNIYFSSIIINDICQNFNITTKNEIFSPVIINKNKESRSEINLPYDKNTVRLNDTEIDDIKSISNVTRNLQSSNKYLNEIYNEYIKENYVEDIYSFITYAINKKMPNCMSQKLDEFSELNLNTVYSTFDYLIYFGFDALYIIDYYSQSLTPQTITNNNLYIKHHSIFRNLKTKGDLIACLYNNMGRVDKVFHTICIIFDIITVFLTSLTILNFRDCCLFLWKIHYIVNYIMELGDLLQSEASEYDEESNLKIVNILSNHICFISFKKNINEMLLPVVKNMMIYYIKEFSEIMKQDFTYFLLLRKLCVPIYNICNGENMIVSCEIREKLGNLLSKIQTNVFLNYVYMQVEFSNIKDRMKSVNESNLQQKYKYEINCIQYYVNSAIPSNSRIDLITCTSPRKCVEISVIMRNLSYLKYIIIFGNNQRDNKCKLNKFGIQILLFITTHDIFELFITVYNKINEEIYNYETLLILSKKIQAIYMETLIFINIIHERIIIIDVYAKERFNLVMHKNIILYKNIIVKLLELISIEKKCTTRILNLEEVLENVIIFFKSVNFCISNQFIFPNMQLKFEYGKEYQQIIRHIKNDNSLYIRYILLYRLPLSYQVKKSIKRLTLFCINENNDLKDNFCKKKGIICQKYKEYTNSINQIKGIINQKKTKSAQHLYMMWQTNTIKIICKFYEIYEMLMYISFVTVNIHNSDLLNLFFEVCPKIEYLNEIFTVKLFSNSLETIYWLGIQYYRINFIIHIYIPYITTIRKHYINLGSKVKEHEIKIIIVQISKNNQCLLTEMRTIVEETPNINVPMQLIDNEHELKYYKITDFVQFVYIFRIYKIDPELQIQELYIYKFYLLFFKIFLTHDKQNETYIYDIYYVLKQIKELIVNSKCSPSIVKNEFRHSIFNRFYKNIEKIIIQEFDIETTKLKMTRDIFTLCCNFFEQQFNENNEKLNNKYIDFVYILDNVHAKLNNLIQGTKFDLKNMLTFSKNGYRYDVLVDYYIKSFIIGWKKLKNCISIFENDKYVENLFIKLASNQYIESKMDYLNTDVMFLQHDALNNRHKCSYYQDNVLINYMISLFTNINALNIRIEQIENNFIPYEPENKCISCLLNVSNKCQVHSLIVKKCLNSIYAILDILIFLSKKISMDGIFIHVKLPIYGIEYFNFFNPNLGEQDKYEYNLSLHDIINEGDINLLHIIMFFFHSPAILPNENTAETCKIELFHVKKMINVVYGLVNKKFNLEIAYYMLLKMVYPLCHLKGMEGSRILNLAGFQYQLIYIGNQLIKTLYQYEIDL